MAVFLFKKKKKEKKLHLFLCQNKNSMLHKLITNNVCT